MQDKGIRKQSLGKLIFLKHNVSKTIIRYFFELFANISFHNEHITLIMKFNHSNTVHEPFTNIPTLKQTA